MPLDQEALRTLRMDRAAAESAAARRALPWIAAGGIAVAMLVVLGAWLALAPEVPVVQVAVVRAENAGARGAGTAVLSASGYVVARRISTPSSKITAQILSVHVEEGMRVRAGQVLARLDDTMPRKQLALAESQLETARRAVVEAEVRLAEARRTLERNRSLREQNLVSQAVLDASEADVKALEARLEVARGEVAVAERSVALARQAVEDTVIRAPFAGVVVSKNAQPGEMISPVSAGGGFTRTGICTIVDMDSLEIEVDVNEAYINRVQEGQRVEAILDAYPDWHIPAHVISIVPTADRQKATVRVRVGLEEKDPRILPDMGVQVRFLEAQAAMPAGPRLLVPERAVTKVADGSTYVFLVRAGRVERRAVRLGTLTAGAYEVLAGLQDGDTVVLDPPAELADGAEIEIAER